MKNKKLYIVLVVISIAVLLLAVFLMKNQLGQKPLNQVAEGDGKPMNCYLNPDQSDLGLFVISGKAYSLQQLDLFDQLSLAVSYAASEKLYQMQLRQLVMRAFLKEQSQTFKNALELPPIDQLLENVIQISDQELKEYYNTNKSGFPKELTYERLKPNLKNHLFTLKKNEHLRQLESEVGPILQSLDGKEQPCPPTIASNSFSGFPTIKSSDKVVSLTYISDFFCTTCREEWPKLQTFMKLESKKVDFQFIPKLQDNNEASKYLAQSIMCVGREVNDLYWNVLAKAFIIPLQYRNDSKAIKKYVENNIENEFQITSDKYRSCMLEDHQQMIMKAHQISLSLESEAPSILINYRLMKQESSTVEGLKKFFTENLQDK